jgi:hypothetical protein
MPPPQRLDRSNDGQDHTVLPYARLACSPHYLPALSTLPEECWRDEPDSAVRPRDALGSRRAIRPAPGLSRPTLLRPPQARLAYRDDVRSPLKDEPGWATHTPFPNFGKAEYFRPDRLTDDRNRVDAGEIPSRKATKGAVQSTAPFVASSKLPADRSDDDPGSRPVAARRQLPPSRADNSRDRSRDRRRNSLGRHSRAAGHNNNCPRSTRGAGSRQLHLQSALRPHP